MPSKPDNLDQDNLVAVTGIGMICPLGVTAPVVWENMLQGKSGTVRITKFDIGQSRTQAGGQLPAAYFKLENEKTSKRLMKKTVRASRIIRLCAQEAIADSAFDFKHINLDRCGVIIGTSGASVRSPDDLGGPDTERWKIVREMTNAPAAWISIENKFRGPSYTISAGYASGAYAIARAYDLIRWGVIDVAVTGGVDCLLTRNNLDRGNLMHVLSTRNGDPGKAMRPFDKTRDGFVLSDGGCAIVLESYADALRRNADIYAVMRGYALFSETKHSGPTSVSQQIMEQSIRQALENAAVSPKKIAYVKANGTSTIDNDLHETAALKNVFGKQAYDLRVSSPKSMIGHCVGGADAIEFAVTALTLKNQKITPTINYEVPDPDCDLNYVPNLMAEISSYQAAIASSFGIDGNNCVIVLTKA